MGYAGQFAVSRKAEMVASGVLTAAVVQNSRKWNVERAPRKKGMRQRGDVVRRRVRMVLRTPREVVMPRAKARRDMPERDMRCPG